MFKWFAICLVFILAFAVAEENVKQKEQISNLELRVSQLEKRQKAIEIQVDAHQNWIKFLENVH